MDIGVLLRVATGVGFLLVACGAGWWINRQLPAATHRYGFAIAAAVGVLGLTFLGEGIYMHTQGVETAATNLGYAITWMLVAAVICAVAGAGQRLTAVVVAVAGGRFVLMLIGTYGMAVLGEVFVMIALLGGLIGSLLAWLYLLQRPLTRTARTRSPERTLLFTKLKYLGVLAWIAHTASIGLFGAMVMVGLPADITRIYLDVIIVLAVVTVTLGGASALEAAAADDPLTEEYGSDGATATAEVAD